MPRMAGVARAGGEPIGIGILGLTPSLSFQVTAFSIARSAGVSILLGGSIRLHFTDTDMAAGAGTDMDTTTIISVPTPVTGGPAPTISKVMTMPTVSIADRDQQDEGSILDLRWPARRGASDDLVALDSTAAAVEDSTAVVEAVFMVVEAGSMVADR